MIKETLLKNDYKLYLKKHNKKIIGTYIKGNSTKIEDIKEIREEELEAIKTFPDIISLLNKGIYIIIYFDIETYQYSTEIRKTIYKGAYNEITTYETLYKTSGFNTFDTIYELNNKIPFEVIDIKDITEEYEQERQKHNKDAINFWGEEVIKKSQYACYYIKADYFPKLFQITINHGDNISTIKFGINQNNTFCIISDPLTKERITTRINKFWTTYKNEILNGKDIKEILSNDKANLLNYQPNKIKQRKRYS